MDFGFTPEQEAERQAFAEALAEAAGLRIYVCNVMTQPGETDGYTVYDHVQAIRNQVGPGLCDIVLANDNLSGELPTSSGSELVRPDRVPPGEGRLVTADLVDEKNGWRHDPHKLACHLMRLLQESRGAEAH